jgi:hypothetical protein
MTFTGRSTIEGVIAFKNVKSGSWFVESMVVVTDWFVAVTLLNVR